MGLEQAKGGFKAILTVAPVPKGKVFAVGNWGQGLKSVDNQKKGIWTNIKGFEAFLNQTADSKRITVKELLKDPIFAQMYKSELKKWRKMRRALTEKYPDGSTKFDRGVEDSKMKYEEYLRICCYPLHGSEKDGIMGLIPLGRMALTGDPRLKKCLKPGLDEIALGKPIRICLQGQLKEFKKVMNHQIHESGRIIIEGGLTEYDLNAQTEQLNRLINLYCSPEIEPFSPGGASHVDFIVRELPGQKLLALDIKVSKRE